MDDKTIFERIDCQNRIWKTGLYDYLFKSVFSIRFCICNFYIRMYSSKPVNVLDVGAGSGTLLSFIYDIAKNYNYNDISDEAIKVFKNSEAFKKHASIVNILHENINELQNQSYYDIIVSLGIAKFVYEKDLFFNLFNNHLSNNGIMILETTESCDGFSYYCNSLPNPIHSIKYEILDNFNFGTSKKRVFNVYKKEQLIEVDPNDSH